jgi:ABC-2 type transport system permease protein
VNSASTCCISSSVSPANCWSRNALAAASRHLFGNPNPAAAVHVWPMQHPEQAVLLWSAALLLVFAPLAVRLYRRKSLG